MLAPVLVSVGDLVEDVVVHLGGPIERATDTPARIVRRRGGSAANVAAFAAAAGLPVRFVGRIGDDDVGDRLIADLESGGVDVKVQRAGRTGTIVVLVEPGGERSMLSDRAASIELDHVPDVWLDGVTVLHVPTYSLLVQPLGACALAMIGAARARGSVISVDASSVHELASFGLRRYRALIDRIAPDVFLANGDEAAVLGLRHQPLETVGLVIVKNGADPAVVLPAGAEVPVPVRLDPVDSTGAGDAFAAGFLAAWRPGAEATDAVRAGHRLAGRVVAQAGARLDAP